MSLDPITQVGVIGAGTMGSGIVEIFAESGYDVLWYNRSAAGIQRGIERIRANQITLTRHGVLTQTGADAALTRLHATHDLTDLAAVDMVSESIVEHLETKQELLRALDLICPSHTLLTTNTSGLPISEIATALAHPARFAGMHFANPPHIIPMVEIIKGAGTSDATCERLTALAERLGKQPVWVQQDVPGFIANRLQFAIIREALHLIESGVASPADVDAAVKHGIGLRWALLGPLEIMDVGGLDVFSAIGQYLFQELSRATEGSKILDELVATGNVGAKSGAGFYTYSAEAAQQIVMDRDEKLLELLQIKRR